MFQVFTETLQTPEPAFPKLTTSSLAKQYITFSNPWANISAFLDGNFITVFLQLVMSLICAKRPWSVINSSLQAYSINLFHSTSEIKKKRGKKGLSQILKDIIERFIASSHAVRIHQSIFTPTTTAYLYFAFKLLLLPVT